MLSLQRNLLTMTTASQNIDRAEIAKFEELAHRWWDRHSEFKSLHDINPLRANYIDERSPVSTWAKHHSPSHACINSNQA